MTIEFSYEGDVSHLEKSERKKLEKDLKSCTRARNWDYFHIDDKTLEIGGSYDDEDGYCDDHGDIERVLNWFEIDWTGGAKYDEDERYETAFQEEERYFYRGL